jgi:polysaccharide biosynthesis/export protein
MKAIKIKYFTILVVLLFLGSCASHEKLIYFQDVNGIKEMDDILNYELKIQKGDELFINVSGLNTEAAIPFNLYESANNAYPKQITYIVGPDGNINFPVLGKVAVEGSTIQQISDNLANFLTDYIKKPIINIRLVNFKISVLGEVNSPGTFDISKERISVLAAIGMAGDLTIHGERENILLVSEKGGKRTFTTINLTNKKLFNSPDFYLSQNDVLYVQPNKAKLNSSAVGTNSSVILSSVSALISFLAIILTIK